MLNLRASTERGAADHGWLDTRHTFSFAGYHDPAHMGFRSLRVLNEDIVSPGRGFGTHGHRDMEILSYVIDGALEHEDNLGNGSIIRPGDVQRMSAGTGVLHSEYNHSSSEPVHFIQIWIVPSTRGLTPSYEQKHFDRDARDLSLLVSPDGAEGSVTLHQDVRIYRMTPHAGAQITLERARDRHLWLQVVRGSLVVEGHDLRAGDAVSTSDAAALDVQSNEGAEALLFDLG